jgi:hypothetical protein
MGRIIEVEYAIKVFCEVDIEEGTVVRVVENVEDIEPTGRYAAPDEGHIDADEATRAIRIAEEYSWPAWERGN